MQQPDLFDEPRPPINMTTLLLLVRAMRDEQIQYFRVRTPAILREAKQLESQVDEVLNRALIQTPPRSVAWPAEPWMLFDVPQGAAIVPAIENTQVFARFGARGASIHDGDREITVEEAAAAAARTITVVNACAGMPSEALLVGVLAQLGDALAGVLANGEQDGDQFTCAAEDIALVSTFFAALWPALAARMGIRA